MRFSTIVSLACATFAAVSNAAANAITFPTAGTILKVGTTVTVTWTDRNSAPTVDLILRSGASNNLDTEMTIKTSVPNTGSYSFVVPSDIAVATDYAIQIKWGSGTDQSNYSDRFTIMGGTAPTTSAASSTVTVSSATTSTATESSTLSTSITSSGSTTTTGSSTSSRTSSTRTSSSTSEPTGSEVPSPNDGSVARSSTMAMVLCVLAAAMYLN